MRMITFCLIGLALTPASVARATTCALPPLRVVYPPDGALDVSPAATIFVAAPSVTSLTLHDVTTAGTVRAVSLRRQGGGTLWRLRGALGSGKRYELREGTRVWSRFATSSRPAKLGALRRVVPTLSYSSPNGASRQTVRGRSGELQVGTDGALPAVLQLQLFDGTTTRHYAVAYAPNVSIASTQLCSPLPALPYAGLYRLRVTPWSVDGKPGRATTLQGTITSAD